MATKQAPKKKEEPKDMRLNTSERFALIVTMNEENELRQKFQEVSLSKSLIMNDIENRLELEPGTLQTKYAIRTVGDEWLVEELPEPSESNETET